MNAMNIDTYVYTYTLIYRNIKYIILNFDQNRNLNCLLLLSTQMAWQPNLSHTIHSNQ